MKPKMLSKREFGENTRKENDEHHNYPGLCDKLDSIPWTFDKMYENYVKWYISYYTKLGQVLK